MTSTASTLQANAFRVTSGVLLRFAGLPFEALDELKTTALGARLAAVEEAEEQVRSAVTLTSDALYAFIGSQAKPALRNLLLEFRRDLFNGRAVSEPRWLRVLDAVPPDLAEALHGVRVLRDEASRRHDAFSASYEESVASCRSNLHRRVADENFAAGLLLSAESLVAAIPRLLASTRERSREGQVERGLLRYLTRAGAKTTPFSRFCVIVEGELVDTTEDSETTVFDVGGALRPMRSQVRLNKGLFGALAAHLRSYAETRPHLPVELNPTLERRDDELCFLASVRGREVFQRLEVNDALNVVIEVIRSRNRPSMTDLSDALCAEQDLETTPEEAEKYLSGLIFVGLLRLSCGVPEQEPDWDIALRTVLTAPCLAAIPQVQELANFLVDLRSQANAYEHAPVGERRDLLSSMRRHIDEFMKTLPVRVHWRVDAPILEDATAACRVRIRPGVRLRRATELLEDYARVMSPLAWPRAEQLNMYHYFSMSHPEDAQVPALRFFEQYYREHFKEHLEKQHKPRGEGQPQYDGFNPFGLPTVERLRSTQQAVSRFLVDQWRAAPNDPEIGIDFDGLREVVAPASEFSHPVGSVSLFTQYWLEPERRREGFVVPNGALHTGYGKYFSRFLYLLDPAFIANVQAQNSGFADVMLAEICGDADFNANLHPPLVPWELSYPTSESGHGERSLNVSDLVVTRSGQAPGTLELRHKESGVRVEPVDLGFMNPTMRPALFQFLSRFNGFLGFSLQLPERLPAVPDGGPVPSAADSPALASEPSPPVMIRPRLIINDAIVIARRRWTIAKTHLPVRAPNQSDSQFFREIQRWRRQYDLPSQVYMRILVSSRQARATPAQSPPADAPAQTEKQNPAPVKPAADRRPRDFRKPQFIDFESPLLAKLFEYAPGDLTEYSVVLEECLPSSSSAVPWNHERYLSECVLQLNRLA
jgi:lantibiotic biosynthesis protein